MRCIINDKALNLPDFLIVGTGKAGTTSLHHYLNAHPSIIMPANKETLFWQIISNPNKTPLRLNPRAITTLEAYADQFQAAAHNQLCGEACPSYLYYYNYTISNLKKYHPAWQKVKIIIVLREPVSKVISQYFFVKNTLKIKEESLERALSLEEERLRENKVSPSQFYFDSTRYANQVKAYLDNFDHVKILFYKDLKRDRKTFVSEILEFLGLDASIDLQKIATDFNVSKRELIPRNSFVHFLLKSGKSLMPGRLKLLLKRNTGLSTSNALYKEEEINEKTIRQLKKRFEPEIEKLEKILDTNLDFWR